MPILGTIASSRQVAAADGFFDIASHTFSGSTSSVTFSSIPQTYRALQIHIVAKSASSSSGGYDYIISRINGATTGYIDNRLVSRSSDSFAGSTAYSSYAWFYGAMPTTLGGTSNMFGAGVAMIHDYALTDRYKDIYCINGMDQNGQAGTTLGNNSIWLQSARLNSTAAISSISFQSDLGSNFVAGSRISLYGIV